MATAVASHSQQTITFSFFSFSVVCGSLYNIVRRIFPFFTKYSTGTPFCIYYADLYPPTATHSEESEVVHDLIRGLAFTLES